jgi:GNAT superfamily N-acetyltransferase
MEHITYRTATLDDLSTLLDFEYGIITFERAFDSNLKPDPTHYYDLKAMILSNDVEVLVAYKDSELIGSGYAKIANAKPYHINSEYAYLGFMYVSPEYRGKGIIQNIINRLLQWTKKNEV